MLVKNGFKTLTDFESSSKSLISSDSKILEKLRVRTIIYSMLEKGEKVDAGKIIEYLNKVETYGKGGIKDIKKIRENILADFKKGPKKGGILGKYSPFKRK